MVLPSALLTRVAWHGAALVMAFTMGYGWRAHNAALERAAVEATTKTITDERKDKAKDLEDLQHAYNASWALRVADDRAKRMSVNAADRGRVPTICAQSGGSGTADLSIDAASTWIVTKDSRLSGLTNKGTIKDADGKTVTIKGSNETVYVQGDSAYTVTVDSYTV